MEQINKTIGQANSWDWVNMATIVAMFVIGSAFWQATKWLRKEQEAGYSIRSWRGNSLLPTYLTLLLGLIGLTIFIVLAPVSEFTFWIGYAAVGLGQLTSLGQRLGKQVTLLTESMFNSDHRAFQQ